MHKRQAFLPKIKKGDSVKPYSDTAFVMVKSAAIMFAESGLSEDRIARTLKISLWEAFREGSFIPAASSIKKNGWIEFFKETAPQTWPHFSSLFTAYVSQTGAALPVPDCFVREGKIDFSAFDVGTFEGLDASPAEADRQEMNIRTEQKKAGLLTRRSNVEKLKGEALDHFVEMFRFVRLVSGVNLRTFGKTFSYSDGSLNTIISNKQLPRISILRETWMTKLEKDHPHVMNMYGPYMHYLLDKNLINEEMFAQAKKSCDAHVMVLNRHKSEQTIYRERPGHDLLKVEKPSLSNVESSLFHLNKEFTVLLASQMLLFEDILKEKGPSALSGLPSEVSAYIETLLSFADYNLYGIKPQTKKDLCCLPEWYETHDVLGALSKLAPMATAKYGCIIRDYQQGELCTYSKQYFLMQYGWATLSRAGFVKDAELCGVSKQKQLWQGEGCPLSFSENALEVLDNSEEIEKQKIYKTICADGLKQFREIIQLSGKTIHAVAKDLRIEFSALVDLFHDGKSLPPPAFMKERTWDVVLEKMDAKTYHASGALIQCIKGVQTIVTPAQRAELFKEFSTKNAYAKSALKRQPTQFFVEQWQAKCKL